MIALVRCSAAPAAGCGIAELSSLPEPPGSRYTAFAIRCRDEGEVREALLWYRTLLDARPGAPLGLIARAKDCIQPVAGLDRSLVFVMDPPQRRRPARECTRNAPGGRDRRADPGRDRPRVRAPGSVRTGVARGPDRQSRVRKHHWPRREGPRHPPEDAGPSAQGGRALGATVETMGTVERI